jgi:hypothetical protein
VAPPALVFPFDAAEAAAFRAAGLPRMFCYTKGRLALYKHDGVAKVLHKPANPVSICALLRR